MIATCTRLSGVSLWNPASGRKARHLKVGNVFRVAFSPDGSRLATCSYDTFEGTVSVQIWDPATGESRHMLEGRGGHAGLHWLRSRTGHTGETVRLWDLTTGKNLHTLEGHITAVEGVASRSGWRRSPGDGGVALSPDWRLLATGGDDQTVRLWDPATGDQVRILEGHTGPVDTAAFSPDGRLLATGGTDPRITDDAEDPFTAVKAASETLSALYRQSAKGPGFASRQVGAIPSFPGHRSEGQHAPAARAHGEGTALPLQESPSALN